MIPQPTYYPNSLDTDDNLFLVHDALRVRLLEDYNPGDLSIQIEGDEEIISKFPPTGIITLTEQCSDIDKRAISFYYGSRTINSFNNLERLPEFTDVVKPKKITNVTMNVLDKHHNHLKDALIAVQTFLGIQDETSFVPFGSTLTKRINFLKKLVLKPKAWFSADKRTGLVPLEVTFKEESLRADENTAFIWNFGDDTTPLTVPPLISVEPGLSSEEEYLATSNPNARFRDIDGKEIKKRYTDPGIYTVSLTVINEFGEDTVVFEDLITAKIEAPEKAIISINNRSNQIFFENTSLNGSNVGIKNLNSSDNKNYLRYIIPPKIRSSTNTFLDLEVRKDEEVSSTGYSYAGEPLNEVNQAIDEIIEYTWDLSDDLEHLNSPTTRASYSIGGYYDLTLRVDTKYGAYRITTYEKAIDIIESQNLWFFNYKPGQKNSNGSGTIRTWEFGLLSKTFKILGRNEIQIDRNNNFLNYLDDSNFNSSSESLAKKEFDRSVVFAQKGTSTSGDQGNCLLMWAKGGPESNDEKQIKITEYNAFADIYDARNPIQNRSWNWASLVSPDTVYFILGSSRISNSSVPIPATNPANKSRTDYNLNNLESIYFDNWGVVGSGNFEDGAEEILSHVSSFNSSGIPENGYFAVYKTTWKDSTGYILRNSAVNDFYRLGDFYKTNGNLTNQFNTLSKLPDLIGGAKTEGELVSLSSGVFLFNNSGDISAWNDTTLTWEIGKASSSSLAFRSLQDSNISGFSDKSNTLLAVSDNDSVAYLSYDYSEKAFIIFNLTDLTFQSAGIRPLESQFKLGLY